MHTLRRRGIAVRAGTVVAAIAAIAAVALPGATAATTPSPSPSPSATSPSPSPSTAPASDTKCVTTGLSTTCTGTYGGDNAWNPWTDSQISQPPVVTVSQTKDLTDQVVNVNWQYFTPTLTMTKAPNPQGSPTYYQVTLFECNGLNPVVDPAQGLGDSCYQVTAVGPEQGIPNAQFGITTASQATGAPGSKGSTGGDPSTWTGQADFHIETGATNSFLGCSVSTQCSLVVVPNWGGDSSSYANSSSSSCGNHARDIFGTGSLPILSTAFTTTSFTPNSYGCAMADRIVVPLSFAPTPSNCPQQTPEFFAQGSPMMSRAMTQWEAKFCTGSAPVSLEFTQTDETDARGAFLAGGPALSARVDMALVTLPPDAAQVSSSSRKFTYAPLANSGVAMAYYLDDGQTGQQINQVVLNPRLVAKLTTESYSLDYGCTVSPNPPNETAVWPPLPNPSDTCDPAVTHTVSNELVSNPKTLFDDPEFLSLNKNCQPEGSPGNYACGASDFPDDVSDGNKILFGVFLPTVLGGESDMTFQLTDWVAANADAEAFLAGKADPWDMQVNTNYRNISYPTESFQTALDPGTKYPVPITCMDGCPSDWDATMNVAWNPVTPLDKIVGDLLELQPNAEDPQLACQLSTGGECTQLSQMGFATVGPETNGARDLFSELDLGDVAAYQFPAVAMVNGAGKAVTPTQASVEAAVKDMKTNADGITQYANESSTDPAAYPLAMVDYAMVPTCGLPSSEASAIADFLDKAATSGQVQGNAPGELAPGYYPLTSAQRAQTLKAAQEVKSQDCKSAPPDHTVSGHSDVDDVVSPSKAGSPTGTTGSGKPGSAKTPDHTSSPTSSPAGKAQTAAFGQKSPDSGLSGILLLLAIIVGAVLLIGGPAAWVLTATGKWPVVLRWLRPVQARLKATLAWITGLAVRRA
jgi:hypothetical protein